MASVTLQAADQGCSATSRRSTGLDLHDRGRRVPDAARPVRLRQEHGARLHRRARAADRWRDHVRRARRSPSFEPHERNVAMVFQDYALYPHMSVRENMSFGLKQQRIDAGDDRPPGRDRGRDAGSRAAARAPAGRAFRRPAPAGRGRPRRGAQPRRVPDGRAALQPRRRPARADPHRDQAPAARPRHHRRCSSPTTRRRRWCSPTGSR